MRFCINKSEDPAKALLRVAREQIGHALAELQGTRNPVEQVHEIRRSLKRLRAVVELATSSPASQNAPGCELLRVAGRLLAQFRDVHVMGRALSKINGKKIPIYASVAAELAREEKVLSRQLRPALEDVGDILSLAAKQMERWHTEEFAARDLAFGVREAFKKARKAFRKARKDPQPEMLHDWRIRTKKLWHCLLLVEPLCPKPTHRMAQKAEKLGDRLGEDRDFALLCQRLETREGGDGDLKALLKLIAKHRGKLQKRAFKLGLDILTGKPPLFSRVPEAGERAKTNDSLADEKQT